MVQWTLLCGIAAICAVNVHAVPFDDDPVESPDELLQLDENFPGLGSWLSLTNNPSSATKPIGNSSNEAYNPGDVHANNNERRLESGKTADMQKLETFFGLDLETDLTKLPTKAQHGPVAWPSSYWPVYADSINYRWHKGELSPAEKYAKAFGHDATVMMDAISAKLGVDSQKKRRKCTVDADCKGLKDGSVCAKRVRRKEGYCVPTWFGICHAWAPAALLETEPTCAVERNGTKFEPYDIKALITLAYDGSKIPTVYTGSRFNGKDNATNNTDEYGRFKSKFRRDLNPGFFHIAITNIMGRFNHSFVIDITAGNEVWNQPARSFEVLRLAWMTPDAAAKKYFNTDKYPFNDVASRVAAVTTRFSWIVESGVNGPLVATGIVDKFTTSADYQYLLETNDNYEIIGGEWLSGSKANHPDFLWLPASKPDLSSKTSLGIVYEEIENLLKESTSGKCSTAHTNTTAEPRTTQPAAAASAAASGSVDVPAPSTPESTPAAASSSNAASTAGSPPVAPSFATEAPATEAPAAV